MQASIKIFIVFFFLPTSLLAQDITGLWTGTLYNDTTKQFYKYEIGISKSERGKLSGFSHTWFLLGDEQFYGVKKLRVTKAKDGKIIIEDNGLISNNYPVSPAKNVRQLNVLTLSDDGAQLQLTGPFATNRTKEYSSLTGSINLTKKEDFRQSALIPHLQELGLDDDLSFVKEENESLAGLARKDYEAKILAAKTPNARSAEITRKESAQLVFTEVKNTEKKQEPELTPTPTLTQPNQIKKEVSRKEIKPKGTRKEKVAEPAETKQGKTQPKSQDTIAKTSQVKDKNEQLAAINPTQVNTATVGVLQSDMKVKKDFALPVADFTKRITILQQTVYFKTDSLQLALYDNGEVDGDTVSIFMNGELLMARQGLSTKAIRKTIYLDHSIDTVSFVMYAENLGTIAPNTGLLVVRDGKDLYEIRFSGDLQKNAAIMFRRRR